jgi:GAF domain-containing protein
MRADRDRLQLLQRLLVLDSAPEVVFDDLTRLLQHSFGVPIAMVNLLDEGRDWFKSCIGLPLSESPASTSFCEAFFHLPDDMLVVEDTQADPHFAGHPLVAGPPHIRFYAAARLVVQGQTVGTLCCYDLVPRQLSTAQREQLQTLARSAMALLAQRIAPPSAA